MKKIGIDLRALQVGHEFRGIGANVRSLLDALLENKEFVQNDLYFYRYDTTNPLDQLRVPEGLKYKTVVLRNKKDPRKNNTKLKKAVAYAMEIAGNHITFSPIPHTNKLDIFIQFDQALGLPRSPFVKKALLIYDFIPLVFRESYLPHVPSVFRKHGWRAGLKTFGFNARYLAGLGTVKRADILMAVSKHTAIDAQKFLGIPEQKVVVVPAALRTQALAQPIDLKKREVNDQVKDKQQEVDRLIKDATEIPYLLYVGGVETPRRRLSDLVGAFHQLQSSGRRVRLVLVGKELGSVNSVPDYDTAQQLKHPSYSDDLFMLGFVSDYDVDRLYEHAAAFTFVSLYEGFGLPVLEGYAKGCQVITYSNSSINEVAGNAAVICEPDQQSLVTAVERVLDKAEGLPTRAQMDLQLSKFSWDRSAEIMTKSILGDSKS